MADSPDVDDIVNQLVNQINIPPSTQPPVTAIPLTPADLEQFLIDQSSALIRGSVDAIERLRPLVIAAPTAEDVEAYSKLVAASSIALEALNKIFIANKKTAATFALKQMDIESKKQLQDTEIQGRFMMNREELINQLIKKAECIDITPESPK